MKKIGLIRVSTHHFLCLFFAFLEAILRFARKRKNHFLRFGRDLPQNAKFIFYVLELKFAVLERRGQEGSAPEF